MAIFIPAGGVPREITPDDGRAFTLPELQRLVGGYIEAIRTPDRILSIMFCNEDGKRERLAYNAVATHYMSASLRPDDYIVGDVVMCSRIEAGESDEPDET